MPEIKYDTIEVVDMATSGNMKQTKILTKSWSKLAASLRTIWNICLWS